MRCAASRIDATSRPRSISINEALRQDPRFALAFAGLADASVAMYRETNDTKWADKAVFAAQQGKRLDDSLLEVRARHGPGVSRDGQRPTRPSPS